MSLNKIDPKSKRLVAIGNVELLTLTVLKIITPRH